MTELAKISVSDTQCREMVMKLMEEKRNLYHITLRLHEGITKIIRKESTAAEVKPIMGEYCQEWNLLMTIINKSWNMLNRVPSKNIADGARRWDSILTELTVQLSTIELRVQNSVLDLRIDVQRSPGSSYRYDETALSIDDMRDYFGKLLSMLSETTEK